MSLQVMCLDRLRDRAFGVELEFTPGGYSEGSSDCDCGGDCTGSGVDWTIDLLDAHGFAAWAESAHIDGSGCEVSSPVLRGKAGLAELYNVVDLLNANGCDTTTDDGLHIHHDAPEFVRDAELVEKLVESWAENVEAIESFVAPYRRGGHWACQRFFTPESVAEFKAGKAMNESLDVYSMQPERFSALNITALRRYGTVEFRGHEGTLDFDQIEAWIRFGQAFLDGVVRRKRPLPSLGQPETLLRRLRVSPGATDVLLAKAAA